MVIFIEEIDYANKEIIRVFNDAVISGCVWAQFNEKVFGPTTNKQEDNLKLYGYNQFIDKIPFAVSDSEVTFFLRGNKAAKKFVLNNRF